MTLLALDVSNLNGMGYTALPQYAAADILIVQAIPRPAPNGLTGRQLRQGAADGKKLGIYPWLWHDPSWRMGDQSVEDDQRLRLATVPQDIELHLRPYIDVEDNQSAGWDRVSVGQRKDDLNRAFDVADAFAHARGLPEAGIYWSAFYINLLFDGWQPEGRKQWRADYGPNPHRHPGQILGGLVVGHQYTSIPIDQSLFLDSEVTATTVHIPQSYVDKFSLANDQDVDGLIANFEGVVTTVREIALAEAGDAIAKLNQIKAVLG